MTNECPRCPILSVDVLLTSLLCFPNPGFAIKCHVLVVIDGYTGSVLRDFQHAVALESWVLGMYAFHELLCEVLTKTGFRPFPTVSEGDDTLENEV